MSENALKCEFKDCELIYENPITLPCGNSMCKSYFNFKFFVIFKLNELISFIKL